MIYRSVVLGIVLLLPFCLRAQKEIQVLYDDSNQSIELVPDNNIIQAGESYRLKILHINPVYIRHDIRIRSFRYISPIPQILKPILPGIPGSDVFDHFKIESSGQREFFLKSLRFYNELEKIRGISDDLYARTRLEPNSALASAKMEELHFIFNTNVLADIVSQINYYQDYILAAESVYENNFKKVTMQTPDADIVLQEYARITRMADLIREIDYVRLLDFIVQSTGVRDYILSDPFSGEKDLTEITLTLYDSYISDTIYSGTLTFHTGRNWAVDFSTGIFYTDLYQKDYYLTERSSGLQDVIEENKFRGDVSVGALTHVTYKFQPDLRIGPALGASISPFDGKIRYLAGIGAFIGQAKIAGISAGVSLGQFKVLSGSVPTDGRGSYLPADEKKIPTYDRLKAGFFIGLTYNLTRMKTP